MVLTSLLKTLYFPVNTNLHGCCLFVCLFVLCLLHQCRFNMKLESCEMDLFLWSFF